MKISSNPLLNQAQQRWKEIVQKNDLVIDATIGNGHDSLFLLQLLDHTGFLVGYDVQQKAIEKTKEKLAPYSNFLLKLQSHEVIEEKGARIICYNLGYLPGSDKVTTTMTKTTIASLESAKKALMPGGLLSIVCYPGHEEGKKEAEAVLAWAQKQEGKLEIIRSPSPFLILLEPAPS